MPVCVCGPLLTHSYIYNCTKTGGRSIILKPIESKKPGDISVIRLPVEGAVTYSPTFAVPSAW